MYPTNLWDFNQVSAIQFVRAIWRDLAETIQLADLCAPQFVCAPIGEHERGSCPCTVYSSRLEI